MHKSKFLLENNLIQEISSDMGWSLPEALPALDEKRQICGGSCCSLKFQLLRCSATVIPNQVVQLFTGNLRVVLYSFKLLSCSLETFVPCSLCNLVEVAPVHVICKICSEVFSEHDLVEIICRVVTEMPNMRDKWEIRGSCCLWKGARQLKRIRGEGGVRRRTFGLFCICYIIVQAGF